MMNEKPYKTNATMLSLKAKFDGKHLRFSQKVELQQEEEVIIIFLNRDHLQEPDFTGEQIQQLLSDSGSLAFLTNDAENVYSDKDLKVKY